MNLIACSFVIANFILVFNYVDAKFVYSAPGYKYATKYVNMPIDHFTFTSNATFQLRYLENATYWSPNAGGPIFFYAGNEGDVTTFADNTGFMWEIAPIFKALVVFAEHRYYGTSLPFGNKSFSDPQHSGYLSTSQVLADYVHLILKIKKDYKVPVHKNPVIVFGGSYGGMLAAWIRMKYPAIVTGSLAASAPIWYFSGLTDCSGFSRVTSSVYKAVSEDCFSSIKNSWKALTELASTDAGKKWITSTFKTCKPINTNEDLTTLKGYMTDVYGNMAMLNYPYPTNFIIPLPGNPVEAACKPLSKLTNDPKVLLTNIYHSLSVFFNTSGTEKCLNVNNANGNLGDEAWDYQACTEIVMPMCSDEETMFEKTNWDFKAFSDACFKRHGVPSHEYKDVVLYGGKEISTASNIIFSNGLLDPWSSGGVLNNVSRSAIAVVIPDSAHHLDLRASHPNDPTSVIIARKIYKHIFKAWIKQHRQTYRLDRVEEDNVLDFD